MRHSSLLRNYGYPGMSYWQLVLSSAPASSPTLLLIGTAGADFPFGGCTNLRVTPTVVASGLPTSSSGFCNTTFSFRHHPSFIGAKLYTQIAAPDAGQPGVPVALSNGVEVTYPRGPIILLRAASGLGWVDASTWPTSQRLTKGTALVLGLQ